jgi:hypothetical protein
VQFVEEPDPVEPNGMWTYFHDVVGCSAF